LNLHIRDTTTGGAGRMHMRGWVSIISTLTTGVFDDLDPAGLHQFSQVSIHGAQADSRERCDHGPMHFLGRWVARDTAEVFQYHRPLLGVSGGLFHSSAQSNMVCFLLIIVPGIENSRIKNCHSDPITRKNGHFLIVSCLVNASLGDPHLSCSIYLCSPGPHRNRNRYRYRYRTAR
jgi:hypothetical protein